jgi:hypothetical protein
VTLIVNVLHRDMSILAADRLAFEGRGAIAIGDVDQRAIDGSAREHDKITVIGSRALALGIAGQTVEHHYVTSIQLSSGIDDALFKIRKHVTDFPRFHDRQALRSLTFFTVNQGIASFFDHATDMYLTCTYQFSQVESQIRLHRASDEPKILYAGSGSENIVEVVGKDSIDAFKRSLQTSATPSACIEWLERVYRRVSAMRNDVGSDVSFVISTRREPSFRSANPLQERQVFGGEEA